MPPPCFLFALTSFPFFFFFLFASLSFSLLRVLGLSGPLSSFHHAGNPILDQPLVTFRRPTVHYSE